MDRDSSSDAKTTAGGIDALDQLFAQYGPSAWGTAFSAAEAVGPAVDAIAEGFTHTLNLSANGLRVEDRRTELLRATRAAALLPAADRRDRQGASAEIGNIREPVSLLGETNDRQATLAFTALSEPMRSALWLVEAEHLPAATVARLIDRSYKATEDLLRQAREGFRRYYADAMHRTNLPADCVNALNSMAEYTGHTLPAKQAVAIEDHVAGCDHCRTIVAKLSDLDARLHDAIPPLPSWAHQHVAEVWNQSLTGATERDKQGDKPWWLITKQRPTLLLSSVACIAIMVVAIAMNVGTPATTTAVLKKLDPADSVRTPAIKAIAPTTTALPVAPVPGTPPPTPPPPPPQGAQGAHELPATGVIKKSVPTHPTPVPGATSRVPKTATQTATPAAPAPAGQARRGYVLLDLPPISG